MRDKMKIVMSYFLYFLILLNDIGRHLELIEGGKNIYIYK